MERYQEIERTITKNYRKKIWAKFIKGITEFKMHKIKIITITVIDKIESIMYNTDIHKKATKY